MTSENYAKLETDFINQLFDLVNSQHAHEKLGAILAIEEIIEGSKNAGASAESTQGVNLANYLRLCFKQINDSPVLYAASRALGKLVRTYGGTLTLETVEAMTVAAIDWLGGASPSVRRGGWNIRSMNGAIFGVLSNTGNLRLSFV
jgi:FKBP12-rapamycin complex-associated protein